MLEHSPVEVKYTTSALVSRATADTRIGATHLCLCRGQASQPRWPSESSLTPASGGLSLWRWHPSHGQGKWCSAPAVPQTRAFLWPNSATGDRRKGPWALGAGRELLPRSCWSNIGESPTEDPAFREVLIGAPADLPQPAKVSRQPGEQALLERLCDDHLV